jgi:DNA helicase-2/ATP-dependent DNA helicase PcrA
MGSNEDLEEERRLCYVGITRARRKLFFTWTPFRKNYGPEAGFPAQVSRFINEMPQELLEGLETGTLDYIDQRPRFINRFHERAEPYQTISRFRLERSRTREETQVQPKTIAELRAYIEQKQRSSQRADEGSSSGPLFKAGMRVRHEQFGDGIVLSRERAGNEIKLTVTFSRVGKKTLVERYAKLKAL